MRKAVRFTLTVLFIATTMILAFYLPVSAHSLRLWAEEYPPDKANDEFSFTFNFARHIEGNKLFYCWSNDTADRLFTNALYQASHMWCGMIELCYKPSPQEAQVKLVFDPDATISRSYARIAGVQEGENHYNRFGGDYSDMDPDLDEWIPQIVLCHQLANQPLKSQKQTMAHELGHLWGIGDLYYDNTELNSIYSRSDDSWTTVTRHDLNAMRIALDNPEFDTGDGRWKYQKQPGVWAKNEWFNGYYYGNDGYRKTGYIITLDFNGGLEGTESVSAALNETLPEIIAPYKIGYTFEGYFDAAGQRYYNANGTPARTWDKSSNTTLYARWTQTKFNVTLDQNGGSGGTESFTVTYGGGLPQIVIPTREEYNFLGYYMLKVGGIPYYDSNGKPVHTWDQNYDGTLYARWAKKLYTVKFNRNGGTGGSNEVYLSRDDDMPNAAMPTRTGYTFDGYYDTASPGGTKYYNADGSSARPWDKSSNATLYAHWTPNTYTVSLDRNGGTGGTSSITAKFGYSMPSAIMPTRTGYHFDGYFDSPIVPNGTQYYNVDGSSAHHWDKASDTVLFAQWTPETYLVTLDKNGGTGGTGVLVATFDQNMPTATMPKREGYIFQGYFDTNQPTGGTKYYNADGTSARAWNKPAKATLYARWEPITFTVHYNANGGSGAPASQTKIYDVDLVLSTVRPQKDNAFFLGWATSPTANQPEYQPGDIYSAEANIILYAVYADVTNLAITADGVAGADGTILSAGDVNVYKFTAPKNGTYQIYFSTINGGITGNVYDADIEPVNHTLSYYDLTGGRDYYVEVINQTAGKSLYSLHIDMSTESHYYMDSSEGNVWLANDSYGNLYSDNRTGTLFRIDKASPTGFPVGYTISADRMYDFYDHNITIPASSPQYLTYTPSTLTTPDPAGGKASMEPYSGTGGQRWDISRLPNSEEYFITSTEGTLEQLLILNTQMPRPFMVSRTAYSSCQEARFTFSARVDLPVADGSYRIANQNTNLFLGMSDSGAVQNENQDIWDIESQNDGTYKIYWHSAPDQVLTYDADEKAVILDADSGQNSQRWKIARCADGSMRISPASSSQILVVRDAANAGAKILLQNDAFDSTGKWSFTQVITDGIYEIQGKTSGKLIHAEHTLNGAPAHLWQPAETLYQKMRFELLDDGAYRITMLSGDGRVLTNPQSLANGAELQFRDWTGEDYQRWFVIDCGDGYFELQNKYSNLVVDISENGTANDTKIQQWSDAGVDAQRFKLLRTNLPFTSKVLNDSTYEIQGKTSQKLIHAANWPNGSPAHLWESADINLQKMHFELQDDGTYRITVLNGNGGVLTNPESYTDGTQLLFSAWTGGDHQRWYVVDLGNGYVKLINKFSGMAIDISENGTANGTKVQQWKDKNTDTNYVDAQQFRLLPTDLPFESMELANGTYEIQAASGKLLHAADWTDGSKAHLWESVENNPLQTMHFERQSDGTYEITVDATGKLLTNPYSYVNGTQLEFSSQAHDDHQKWYVVDDGDGYVTLINKFSGLAIDVSENGTANGTRIQQWQDTGVAAQRFRLIPIA